MSLLSRLCDIADAMVDTRAPQISDAALRQLREEIEAERKRLSDDQPLIGYEARCAIECIAELAYARTDKDRSREERAKMYLNGFRVLMRGDLDIARRSAQENRQ